MKKVIGKEIRLNYVGGAVKSSLILLCIFFNFSSCKKFVVVNPPETRVTENNVFYSDATAIAVLNGLYIKLSAVTNAATDYSTISLLTGLSSDELALWSGVTNNLYITYYTNSLVSGPNVSYGAEFWNYSPIYTCNAAIEGLTNATGLTPIIRSQLLGEAKFMRAFYYYYLTSLYGDLPLVLTTDYEVNRSLSRSSRSDVYLQIISDLIDAQDRLSPNYLDGTLFKTSLDRVRPTRFAAKALLARVYLHLGDWGKSEAQASDIINNNSLYDTVQLNNVFLKNTKEAIWQLPPVNTGWNTEIAKAFVLPASGPNDNLGGNPVYLSDQTLTSFEPGDQRRVDGNWVKSVVTNNKKYFFPYKYKVNIQNAPVTEYLMVLRLGEQFLIRAEARARQGKTDESKADLNVIRTRAGLPNTTTNDKDALIAAILHERQVELFTEWGDRWINLQRTGLINSVMQNSAPQKGGTWESYKALYPLPYGDIQRDPNLTQNQGY